MVAHPWRQRFDLAQITKGQAAARFSGRFQNKTAAIAGGR
jgi:hypothetical protein